MRNKVVHVHRVKQSRKGAERKNRTDQGKKTKTEETRNLKIEESTPEKRRTGQKRV